VIELIGGAGGVARSLVEAALRAGKGVVTANKALLAEAGPALASLAERSGGSLAFEAAVAGGLPVIKTLREGLIGNEFRSLHGILNGTSNYILTEMRESRREFGQVLAEAQALGYAEADPSFDIDGIDAAHKLAILAALAFGGTLPFSAVHVEGIRHLSVADLTYAEELGFRIKLLGIARRQAGGIELRVHPAMVPKGTPLAHVEGVFNALQIDGDAVGRLMLEGRGAGAGPTASAVVADLADLARGMVLPPYLRPAGQLRPLAIVPKEEHVGAYYIRLTVVDRPGVIAEVAAALRDEDISVEALIQRARDPGEGVPVVITTHETSEARMSRALARISALASSLKPPQLIRIESV